MRSEPLFFCQILGPDGPSIIGVRVPSAIKAMDEAIKYIHERFPVEGPFPEISITTVEAVVNAIVELFLEDGDSHTAAEAAERLKIDPEFAAALVGDRGVPPAFPRPAALEAAPALRKGYRRYWPSRMALRAAARAARGMAS